MPELGKATYFLIANTTQYDAALAMADEKSIASANTIGTSMDRAAAGFTRLGTSAGVNTLKVETAETRMATAAAAMSATAERNGLRVAASGAATVKAVEAESKAMNGLAATATTMEKSTLGAFGRIARHAKGTFAVLLAYSLYTGIKKMQEHSAVAAETAKQVTKLGNAHFTSSKKITEMADEMSRATGLQDDVIQHSANVLLTFRGAAPIIKQVTGLAQDMSRVFKQDAARSAIILGKAISDPVKGATALRRIGVLLTEQQMASIKGFVATGQKAKAVALIMKEVNDEVGGQAVAYGKTFPGAIGKLRHAFEQFSQVIASAVMPIMKGILSTFQAVFGGLAKHTTTIKAFTYALLALGAALAIGKVVKYFTVIQAATGTTKAMALWTNIVTKATKAWTAAQWLLNIAMDANPIILIGVAVVALVVIILKLTGHMPSLATMWRATMTGMKVALLSLVEIVKGGIYVMLQIFTLGIRGILEIASHIPGIGGKAKAALKGINDTLTKLKPDFGKAAKVWNDGMKHTAKEGGKGAVKGVQESISPAQKAAIALGEAISAGVKSGMKSLKDNVTSQMVAVQMAMRGGNRTLIGEAQQNLSDAMQDVNLGVSGGAAHLRDLAQTALDDMKTKADTKVKEMLASMTKRITNAQDSFKRAFGKLGDALMTAFDSATDRGLRKLDSKLSAYQSKIAAQLAAVNRALDIRGAAKTPAEQAMQDLQDKRAAEGRAKAIEDAKAAMASAKTPQDYASAVKQMQDAQDAVYLAGLQTQADAERKALDEKIQVQRDSAQKQADSLNAAYQARIDQAKIDYQSERELYKAHLAKWLQLEQAWLIKHPKMWRQEMGRLLKVFGPEIMASAKLLGRGFVGTLAESVQTAGRAAFRITASQQFATQTFGKNLAHGIIAGLGGALPIGLYDALVASINAALAGARKHYGVKSPSTVTAEQLGRPLAQGIEMGFLAHMDKAAASMMTAVTGSISAPSMGRRAPLALAGGATGVGARMAGSAIATRSASGGERGGWGGDIVQHITRTDPDPFQLLQEAKHAAEGVFG